MTKCKENVTDYHISKKKAKFKGNIADFLIS